MSDGAAALIANAKELPVMPPVAAEVMKKAEDPDTDLPSLTAQEPSRGCRSRL